MLDSLLFYCGLQLINVIFATIKYITTIKSSPFVAAITNALSYTISALITLVLVKHTGYEVIIITFITNMLGVPIGKWIINACTKDRLWVYNATVRCTETQAFNIRAELKNNGVHSTYETIVENSLYSLKFFAYSKDDSRKVKNMLKDYDSKYYIIEPI